MEDREFYDKKVVPFFKFIWGILMVFKWITIIAAIGGSIFLMGEMEGPGNGFLLAGSIIYSVYIHYFTTKFKDWVFDN